MKGLEEIFPGEQGPVLLTSPQAIFYTTGFYTTARRPNQIGNQCVLMDEQFTLFFCPRNWGDVIRPQLDSQITLIPCDPSPAALAEAVCRALPRKPERLGLEEETIILPLYLALREQLPETSLWDVTSRLYRARMKKTPAEIAGLRRSANLAKEAMEHACDILRPGVAELDVVAELEYFMRKNGSEGTPFTMKVLSGDNALRTINLPGTRKLAQARSSCWTLEPQWGITPPTGPEVLCWDSPPGSSRLCMSWSGGSSGPVSIGSALEFPSSP